MLQLQKASAGDTQEADYQRIIHNKTASLFVAAALSAAISAQATPVQEEAVRSYAENLGMAFQIKDDIFDYQENASIGKPVGQDLQEQKITLPLLGALQAAPEQEASVRRMVTQIGEHPEYQMEIVAFVKARGGMDYAVARLDEYVDKAIAALDVLPQGEDRQALADLARFVSERKS